MTVRGDPLPPARARRWGLAGLLVPLVVLDLLLSLPHGEGLGDFGSFVASGQAAAAGLNPYAVYPLTARGTDQGREVPFVNLNPPVSLLVFEGVAALDPYRAFRAWYLLALAIYLLVALLLLRIYRAHASPARLAWLLCLAGLWDSVAWGQVYVPLLLLSAGAWLLLRSGRERAGGLLIGLLVAAKPNFLVWPALLLAARSFRAAGPALLVGAALTLAPALRYGGHVYLEWIDALRAFTWLAGPNNASLPGLAARLGLPWLGLPLSVALLGALLVWAWRSRPSSLSASRPALVASLLASPTAWVGYTLLLLPIFLERPWTTPIRAAAALLVVPFPLIWLLSQSSPLALALLGSLYNVALLLVFGALAREASVRAASAGATAPAGRAVAGATID